MHDLRLDLIDLAANYGPRRVFAGVSLELRGGDTLVVAGHNGSGKSTLLRLLCGLQRPTAGRVVYHAGGARYAPDAARPLVGWVAPDLRRTTAELEALLEAVELGGRGDDLLAAYSSGMAQRLRYAYALLHAPPVLLLDEPTATLDERGAALVERIVARQRERGIIVVATNDPRELRWGDHVLRLGG